MQTARSLTAKSSQLNALIAFRKGCVSLITTHATLPKAFEAEVTATGGNSLVIVLTLRWRFVRYFSILIFERMKEAKEKEEGKGRKNIH